jgi:hypothetical protein
MPVTGSGQHRLARIRTSDEFQRHITRGLLTVEHIGVVGASLGGQITALMSLRRTAGATRVRTPPRPAAALLGAEYLVTAQQFILDQLAARLGKARSADVDAIEFDNVDAYQNKTGLTISAATQEPAKTVAIFTAVRKQGCILAMAKVPSGSAANAMQ